MPDRQLDVRRNGKHPSCLDMFCGPQEVVYIGTKRQSIGKREVVYSPSEDN